MRDNSATIPPCPPPARPACWAEIRDSLYPALRGGLGLTEEAALAAAERGADAAVIEARLITLAEAHRWGRPFTGEPTPTVAPLLDIEDAVADVAYVAYVGEVLARNIVDAGAGERDKAVNAVKWILPLIGKTARALETRLYRTFDEVAAAKGAAPRNTDQEDRA